jgi:hypothetical protein
MFQASQGESRAASTLRQDRMLARTPSPTPSEVRLLQGLEPLDWQKPGNWEFWTRKEWVCAFIVGFWK